MRTQPSKILAIAFLLVASQCFCQTNKTPNRIAEIKNWYKEIQSIGLKNCSTDSYIVYDRLSPETSQIPFTQRIKSCSLNDRFSVLQGEFNLYESIEKVNVYLQHGKIFFVFIELSAEAYSAEYRYYCDTNENIILELNKESYDPMKPLGENIESKQNLNKPVKSIIEFNRFKF
jgi:hypothetical protein